MSFRGTIVNGRVELEAGARIPEGTEVDVEPRSRSARRGSRKPKGANLLALAKLALKGGPKDMSAEHDHYAYGTPKRRKAGTSRARRA
jgi:hypothetical protein